MIVRNMPAAEYFARPEISNSLLGLVRKAPALAKAYLDGTYTREETWAPCYGHPNDPRIADMFGEDDDDGND